MDFKEFSEGTGSLKPGWMLKKDPELAKKLKDQQDRKKFVAGEPTKKEVKEDMEESHAPVAPVPDKKYIKGTPEHKAYKATKKPINGMPTNNVKEAMSNDDKSSIALRALVAKKNLKQADGKVKSIDFLKKMKDRVAAGNNMKEETMPQSFKGFLTSLTELTDKQKKHIDKNKNGKIDAHDFKLLQKEEDQIEEKSDQAKQNKTMKNMMDASRGAKFKLNNPVPDAEPEHKTAQAHNKAIGRALRNEAKAEDPPFDGPYKKVTGDGSVKDKSGAVHTPMSRARDLARKAMQQKMKEDFNLEITEEQAAELCDLAVIDEKMDMSKADMGDVIKDFQKSDAPQFAGKSKEKRREMAIAAKMKSEETTVKSYRDFVTEIKMADLPSRTVKGTSYGAQYHDPEGDDDADTKKSKAAKPADAPKRGRGRPSGSKSGAKQQGSEKSSNYGGIDRTTYALRLPNNNK